GRRGRRLAVRQVVEKGLVPVAAEHDREGRVPDEIVAELADLGVFAALVPPAHGGLGLDPATWTMVIEEVARVWAAPALLAVAQGGVAFALGIAGGDTARHLPALGRAETLAAVVPIPAALARRDGAACVLDGETAPIAHAARAGLLALTLADGAAWWLVPASLAGVPVAAAAPDLGVRGAPRAPVRRRRRGGGHARVHADPRRLRLHDGVSRRALLPRRRRAARGRARGRAALMAYGRYFEEFTVGEVLRHWPGRTINEADCTWFALLTMNQHPVHSDAHYAATHTQHGQRLVLGPLVFSIGIGMTVADVSGKAIANLEIEKITHD